MWNLIMRNLTHLVYERLTGRPYITTRSMTEEFGPTLATRYPALSELSDRDWLVHDPRRLAGEIEALRSTAVGLPQGVVEAAERLLVRVLIGRVSADLQSPAGNAVTCGNAPACRVGCTDTAQGRPETARDRPSRRPPSGGHGPAWPSRVQTPTHPDPGPGQGRESRRAGR